MLTVPVDAAADGSDHVPYRSSALTRLLASSLGGRCRTSLIACLSGSAARQSESERTLSFASRVGGMSTIKAKTAAKARPPPADPMRGDVHDPVERLNRRAVVIETANHGDIFARVVGPPDAPLLLVRAARSACPPLVAPLTPSALRVVRVDACARFSMCTVPGRGRAAYSGTTSFCRSRTGTPSRCSTTCASTARATPGRDCRGRTGRPFGRIRVRSSRTLSRASGSEGKGESCFTAASLLLTLTSSASSAPTCCSGLPREPVRC